MKLFVELEIGDLDVKSSDRRYWAGREIGRKIVFAGSAYVDIKTGEIMAADNTRFIDPSIKHEKSTEEIGLNISVDADYSSDLVSTSYSFIEPESPMSTSRAQWGDFLDNRAITNLMETIRLVNQLESTF